MDSCERKTLSSGKGKKRAVEIEEEKKDNHRKRNEQDRARREVKNRTEPGGKLRTGQSQEGS